MLKNKNIINGFLNMDYKIHEQTVLKDSDCFLISDEFDLMEFRDLVNDGFCKNAILGADIYVSKIWSPIGSREFPFSCCFDGRGFSVSFTCKDKDLDPFTSSLFGFTHNACIMNLKVNANIVSSKINASGLIHYSEHDICIKKCDVKVIYMFTSKGINNDFGGLIGRHEGEGKIEIEDCSVVGVLDRRDSRDIVVGGFIGWDNVSDSCVINNSCASIRSLFEKGNISGENCIRYLPSFKSIVNIFNCYYVEAVGNSSQGLKLSDSKFCNKNMPLL